MSRSKTPMKCLFYAALSLVLFIALRAQGDDRETIAKAREARQWQDDKKAIDILKPLADQKSPEAMMLLSAIYSRPSDVSLRNPVAAEALIDSAVELSYPPALTAKARYYLHDPKSKNAVELENGMQLLERASELGDGNASLDLAYRYREGTGTAKDARKSFHFASRALDQGHEGAPFLLARSLRDGSGTELDRVKAYAFFLIDCYRPSNLGCDEARKLSASLTKAESVKGIEFISRVLRDRPDLVRVQPPMLSAELQRANKAELIRRYVSVSPLHSSHYAVTARYYNKSMRPVVAHAFLLSQLPWKPAEWGSNHPKWADTLVRFTKGLERIDSDARTEFDRILSRIGSLAEQIRAELSEDELRDLIALYTSPLGSKLRVHLELALDLQFESAKQYWENAAAFGVERYSANARESYRLALQKLPEHKQRLEADCSFKFYKLIEGAGFGIVHVTKAPLAMALVQTAGNYSDRRGEWLSACLNMDYFEENATVWQAVGREVSAIRKWRDRWVESEEMRNLNAHYLAAIEKLQAEEGQHLKPPPRCPDGYWPESRQPDAPCVKRTDGRLTD